MDDFSNGLVADLRGLRGSLGSLSAFEVAEAKTAADEAASSDSFSVTDKPHPPPGGTINDYWSQARYWWPDPDSVDGLPYIWRDGQNNPEINDSRFDAFRLLGLCETVQALTRGWLATRHQAFAERAAHLLQIFFIRPKSRMNPHLMYAQSIPGRCNGRCIGLIETEKLIFLIDWVLVLQQDDILPQQVFDAIRHWFSTYLDWQLTSELGQLERNEHNNHGTWMDAQIVTFALFTGRDDIARSVLKEVPSRRIDKHIDPDGRQPHEIVRTRSWNYSIYNLHALFTLAALGQHVGVDLWRYESADGRSLRRALVFLSDFAATGQLWPYPQIGGTADPAQHGVIDGPDPIFVALLRQGAAMWGLKSLASLADQVELDFKTPSPTAGG